MKPCIGCSPGEVSKFATVTHQFGSSGDLPIAGDWDGDGRDEIGVFHLGVFLLTVDFSEVNASTVFGQAGDLPMAADWAGTHIDDVGVYHPPTATMQIELVFGFGPGMNFAFGLPGDQPVTGHWQMVLP